MPSDSLKANKMLVILFAFSVALIGGFLFIRCRWDVSGLSYCSTLGLANEGNAYKDMGLVRIKRGHFQEAIPLLTKSLETDPQDADTYYYRGIANAGHGFFAQAVADYTKAILINPRHAAALHYRGFPKERSGDYKGAIADYTKAIGINPDSWWIYNSRGHARIALGDNKGAIADYTQAIAIKPQFSSYFSRAKLKENLADYKGAVKDYTESIRIKPRHYVEEQGVEDPYGNSLFDWMNQPLDWRANAQMLLSTAYYRRANTYLTLNNKNDGCADHKKAVSLDKDRSIEWLDTDEGAWCRNMK